jgi:hypothetical protein
MQAGDRKTDTCIFHRHCRENPKVHIVSRLEHAANHIVPDFRQVNADKENGGIIFCNYREFVFFEHEVGELYFLLQFLLHVVYLFGKMNFSGGNGSAELSWLKRARCN